jgi:hypothetical protein
VTCWSCQTENDLSVTQTCTRCGAPLSSRGGFFRKPFVLGVALGLVLLQTLVMLWVLGFRACH